jgi:hypothetical protein
MPLLLNGDLTKQVMLDNQLLKPPSRQFPQSTGYVRKGSDLEAGDGRRWACRRPTSTATWQGMRTRRSGARALPLALSWSRPLRRQVVAMVEPAESSVGSDCATLGSRHRPPALGRRLLVESQARAVFVVVTNVIAKQPSEMIH